MRRVLAVGAHPDDIELGCGGTILAHREAGDEVTMLVLTSGQSGPGNTTLRRAEQAAASEILGASLIWGEGTDCNLSPDHRLIVSIESAIYSSAADVVYVHAIHDTHQDHRAAAAAALSATRRSQKILHYQSPSSQAFTPTIFVDIMDHLGGKLAALACHSTQVGNSAMVEPDVVSASARHIGALGRLTYAEGFVPARFVWDLAPVQRRAIADATASAAADVTCLQLTTLEAPAGPFPVPRGRRID
jgi:LmbE family N-acetylglucosaminyl deacetylase